MGMKTPFITILLVLCSQLVWASKGPTPISLKDAPLEWLIVQTLQDKLDHSHDLGEHLEGDDELTQKIFSNMIYLPESDEIVLSSNKKTHELKKELVHYLSWHYMVKGEDPLYKKWESEEPSLNPVSLSKKEISSTGYYYFNHIHTNISQDNSSLKLLKIPPKKTFQLVDGFLKMRKAKGVVAFCDHDTDKAYDIIKNMQNSRLKALRSIEWGGSTHMSLVGIKKDWELLSKGREFRGEDSIVKSRSSEGFRIVNHPNRKGPFKYTSWLDVDGAEVWNTIMENLPYGKVPIKRSNNRDALKQWSDSLKIGKSHTAVSGSDFHFIIPCLRDRAMFYPANYIPSGSMENAKEQMMKGNVSFLTRPTSPKLNLEARFPGQAWSGMGDRLSGSGELQVKLTADFSDVQKPMRSVCYNTVNTFYKLFTFWKKRKWEVRFYNLAGEVVAKKGINPKRFGPKKSFTAEFSLPVNGEEIIRAELWQINKKSKRVDLLGATNPIYFNR